MDIRHNILGLIGANIVGQNNQIDISGKLPEILQKITKIGGMPYSRIKKVGDYFYEMDFNNVDYDFGKKYMAELYAGSGCLCTVVQNGNIIGRNLDEYFDESVTVLIRVAPGNGRYGSVGLISGIPSLNRQLMESGEYADVLLAAPFHTVDAVNEKGLFAEINLLNREESKGRTTGTVPAVELRDKIAMPMLVRYVVDHYATVDEAVAGIRDYVSVYVPERESGEFHFLLTDGTKTVIMEFVENAVKVREVGPLKDYPAIMANFYVDGVELNNDNTITRNTSSDPDAVNQNGVTPYGSGIERHNLAVAGLSNADTIDGMKSLMRNLFYTKSYTLTENKWFTEFVGDGLKVTTPDAGFADIMDRAADAYAHRDRNNPLTWQTVHSVVYDLANKTLAVCVQQGETYYMYAYDQMTMDIANVVKSIVPSVLILQSENDTTVGGYAVPALTVEQVEQAYNAVVTGRGCIIIDHEEKMHAYVNQADALNDELSIAILFYSSLILTYTISGDTVVVTHTEL